MNPKDVAFISVTALHRAVFSLSGGRLLGGVAGMPVVELTTKGRKSGKRRTVMLTSPLRHEGNYVVVASKGGDPHNPSWYHNLVADPEVEVSAKGKKTAMQARVATGEERAELWPKVTEVYEGYGGYQEKTAREIPLVILEG